MHLWRVVSFSLASFVFPLVHIGSHRPVADDSPFSWVVANRIKWQLSRSRLKIDARQVNAACFLSLHPGVVQEIRNAYPSPRRSPQRLSGSLFLILRLVSYSFIFQLAFRLPAPPPVAIIRSRRAWSSFARRRYAGGSGFGLLHLGSVTEHRESSFLTSCIALATPRRAVAKNDRCRFLFSCPHRPV